MKCLTSGKQGAEVLMDYAAGKLDRARAAELEHHMESCDSCRGLALAQQEMWRGLDAWSAPEVSPSFDAQVYARIAREQAVPGWLQAIRRITRPAVPVALWKPAALAAACAVLVIGFMVRTPELSNGPQMDADRVDIEQVANTLEDLDMLVPAQAPAM
jgi:anti-sigma factor RsiW